VFSGDLYQTTGPYFGGAFNPSAVGYRRVGTLTFDATDGNSARLTYTVDGTPVAKNVTRQLWRYENLSGEFEGGLVYDQSLCRDPSDNNHIEAFGVITFTRNADGTLTMALQVTAATVNGVPQIPLPPTTFNVTGAYSQAGHMGRVTGTGTIIQPGLTNPTWTGTLFEIERGVNGIGGRVEALIPDPNPGCRADGHFGGVLR
jgi:hypothetical protein